MTRAPGPTLRHHVRGMIRHGTSRKEVVLTVLVGTGIAVFPVLGVTALICAGVAHRFRLNHILIQAVNYLALPLQLLLFIPFVRLGESVFGHEGMTPDSLGPLFETLAERPLQVFVLFLKASWVAIGAWALTVLPLLFFLLWVLARRPPQEMERRRGRESAPSNP